jgi:hypothetical protein
MVGRPRRELHHHGIGIVGSTENVVNVKFKTPQKARAVVNVDCAQLWISLVDRDGFLLAMGEKTFRSRITFPSECRTFSVTSPAVQVQCLWNRRTS